MEYFLKSGTQKKSRLTIGYLYENRYDEFGNQMLSGVFEAAKKHDVNIIRFAYYASQIAYKYTPQINMVQDHIEQYDLDGLLFVGWTKAAHLQNFESILERFGSLPLLCIGRGFDNIPNVIFQGNEYFRNLLLHLIQVHNFKRIAYISPFVPDDRNKVYIDTLREYGLFHPELIISETELINLEMPKRGRKALSILLDERKVSFDAIISLHSHETMALIDELKVRGFNVPKDIAVTGYEDGEQGRYSSPSLTTVYFPWRELGFSGCEKLIELLNFGRIPMSTSVPGRIILRNSCGCTSGSINLFQSVEKSTSTKYLEEIKTLDQNKLSLEIKKQFPFRTTDINLLVYTFINDIRNGSNLTFINELEIQLGKISISDHHEIEDLVSIFRKMILPHLANNIEYLRIAGELFQQTQVLITEKVVSLHGNESIITNKLYQTLHEISQILTAKRSIYDILNSLEENLPKLSISGCLIFLFDFDDIKSNLFDNCSIIFEYQDSKRILLTSDKHLTTKQILSEKLLPRDRAYKMLAHLLHVTDEFIGFILYEPGPSDERIFQALTLQISSSLSSALLLDELRDSHKELVEQAHREGMSEIVTGVLHNVGNVLNSVNSSVYVMKELVNKSPVDDLLQANKLLDKNIDKLESFMSKDAKGQKLMNFYLKLGVPFKELKKQLLYHICRLDEKIILINEVINAQQSYAGINSTMEKFDISSIVEDVVKMQSASLEKFKIKIIRNYDIIPMVSVQKTKLFHILVNIIKNSIEAMQSTPLEDRKLTFLINQNANATYLRISDTGQGISIDSLEKIFAYGYTTKKNGHGFGLHSSANYMTEMGGKLWAESEGLGKGSTFILQFK